LILIEEQKAPTAYIYRNQANPSLFNTAKTLIDFTDHSFVFNDFKRQPLMPMMISQCGPRFAVADINKDGLADIFVGASQGQPGALYEQQQNGSFTYIPNTRIPRGQQFHNNRCAVFGSQRRRVSGFIYSERWIWIILRKRQQSPGSLIHQR